MGTRSGLRSHMRFEGPRLVDLHGPNVQKGGSKTAIRKGANEWATKSILGLCGNP